MIRWPTTSYDSAPPPPVDVRLGVEPPPEPADLRRYLAAVEAQRESVQRQIAAAAARIEQAKAAMALRRAGATDVARLEEEHRRVLDDIATSTALEVRRILDRAHQTATTLRAGGGVVDAGSHQPGGRLDWPPRP